MQDYGVVNELFVRYDTGERPHYGRLQNNIIHQLRGNIFEKPSETGISHHLSEVKLLYPCEPTKILAVGANYKSHLEGIQPPLKPEIFYKPVSALQNPDSPIILPADATDLHYEGELVIVIGKVTRNISVEQAAEAIFGVTCGNDVSEREWQGGSQKDLQWWRAKGADTFAPLGPAIVTNLEYGNLLLQTRLNGELVQQQSTSDLLFDCPTIVSFISRYITLMPGDVIFTGTPGATRKMHANDVVVVSVEGVGELTNRVESS